MFATSEDLAVAAALGGARRAAATGACGVGLGATATVAAGGVGVAGATGEGVATT